jgi:hypothetical protein
LVLVELVVIKKVVEVELVDSEHLFQVEQNYI